MPEDKNTADGESVEFSTLSGGFFSSTSAVNKEHVEFARETIAGHDEIIASIKSKKGLTILTPWYNPKTLAEWVSKGNTLGPSIEVMEVNVHGTGHSLVLDKDDVPEPKDVESAKAFFKEPYVGRSMISIRREFGRDSETTGNGYLEVLRATDGSLVYLRNKESAVMRLVALDDPVPFTRVLHRGGAEKTVTIMKTDRRYVEIGSHLSKPVFYKEFGAGRDLHRETGEWASASNPVSEENRATEIIHSTIHKVHGTPYGIPRWINQAPSVVGARKAEELNLDFFDAGGLPPIIMFITGGKLTKDTRQEVQEYLTGDKRNIHRAAILEIKETGGMIDKPGKVGIQVERFGSERQQDSMFSNYGNVTSNLVRSSFRFSELFQGLAGNFNFATAFAAYSVAENQTFLPERVEFDNIINLLLMPEFGPGIKFVSNPLVITDGSLRLRGVKLLTDVLGFPAEDLVQEVNSAVGTKVDPSAVSDLEVAGTEEVEGAGQSGTADASISNVGAASSVNGDAPLTTRSSDRV